MHLNFQTVCISLFVLTSVCLCVCVQGGRDLVFVCKNKGWGLKRPCKGEDRKPDGS